MSKRKKAARLLRWRRYRDRIDRLTDGQDMTYRIEHPMHTSPGYFRAEGWRTDAGSLRHGS